jgi:DNA-binding response OmpR family regulator
MRNAGGLRLSASMGKALRALPLGNAQGGRAKAPRQLRILIADDDRDQVLTLTALLRDEGHEVLGLYRGKGLVEAVKDFDPDALILDIKLPDASGFELAEQIRRRYGEKTPLLIAISGVFKKGVDRILAEMVGFDHHLTKPFEFNTLQKLIEPLTLPGDRRN